MDELEKTAQETAEETGGMAPDAGEQQVPDGEQGVPGGEEDFETLIRGRYKGEFDARVRRILDGRLRGLRQENERLREMAAAAETARQREQEAQLQAAMEFAVIRARQQMAQAIASGGSRVGRTADGAGASAAGTRGGSAVRSWRRYGREYRMERRSDFRKGEKTWR